MQSQRQCLHGRGPQPYSGEAAQADLRAVAAAVQNPICVRFRADQFVEVDALVLLQARKQAVHARQRSQAVVDSGAEVVQVVAAGRDPAGDGPDHAQQVARAVLKFGHQHLQALGRCGFLGCVMAHARDPHAPPDP